MMDAISAALVSHQNADSAADKCQQSLAEARGRRKRTQPAHNEWYTDEGIETDRDLALACSHYTFKQKNRIRNPLKLSSDYDSDDYDSDDF
ncbi:hypothetical protein THAOC_15692 [Thalassiosira oceanica]|uniref:Uncharacterized protein n=1 Tax=Thalassiosira oceanica TaxID=159749 RepID=K0SF72_THAOC|nr:hypothetical protein THAOC_15692 [Thalassiosira oceanica]|eukprot:EJK63639.1 hypothetical protein THAOC_15692 [Thalassiosira oceanica]